MLSYALIVKSEFSKVCVARKPTFDVPRITNFIVMSKEKNNSKCHGVRPEKRFKKF